MKGLVETQTTLTSASLEELTRELLVRLGEDPKREGLVRTPEPLLQRHINISPRVTTKIRQPS